MTFTIFSCFLHTNELCFKAPDKAIILRGCDFFDLFVFLHTNELRFKAPDKAVILRGCDFFDLFVFSAYSTSCMQAPTNRHPEGR